MKEMVVQVFILYKVELFPFLFKAMNLAKCKREIILEWRQLLGKTQAKR